MAKDYSKMNNKELIEEIKKLDSRKSYGLVWEDKPEDVVERCEKELPVLIEESKNKIEKDVELPTNIIIEGDNYHALSVLNYTHQRKIDVIYIDPPYNTGARDWKYNNNYVDGEDSFRHSKWISMMRNRLVISKKLLADDGVLICAIDDNELFTLGLLLEEIFPEKVINTVVIVNNPHGVSRSGFSRCHEYALFLLNKGQTVNQKRAPMDVRSINLRRSGNNSLRSDSPTMFYPIYLDKKTLSIIEVGDVPDDSFHPEKQNINKGDRYEIWPIDSRGVEKNWYYSRGRVIEKGNEELEAKWYQGLLSVYFHHSNEGKQKYKSVWNEKKYDAGAYGSTMVKNLTGTHFPFPKSLHTTLDSLKAVITKKDSLVLDFFAGSGTTGHAVIQLNKEDKGSRCFILCTNNENKIAEEVTYPRIKKVIEGHNDIESVPANLRYYKTDFVDVGSIHNVSDQKKIELTYQAGRMIALREDTFEEVEKNDWWQIFTNKKGKATAIYFKEDKVKLDDLVKKIKNTETVALYIFSWGKNEYKNEFSEHKNIRVEDIPEPILEVYKEVNRS